MDYLIQEKNISGLCRFCLKNNGSKDIKTEYSTNDSREVYQEMIENVFNIQLLTSNHLDSSQIPRVICEECIRRLRDAAALKQTVLQSQEALLRFAQNLSQDIQNKNTLEESLMTDIKTEISMEDNLVEIFPDDNFDEDHVESNIKAEASRLDDVTDITSQLIKQNYVGRLSAEIREDSQKDWSKIVERRGDGPLLRENSLKLISNSTLCVFQWNKSRYRCFCCKEPFSDIDLLRQHTDNAHSIKNIEKKIIVQQNKLVKVEISKLSCRMCGITMDSLSTLRRHLSDEHAILFASDDDLLVPFKLQNDLKCQICHERFSVFRLLNIHVNKHYRKHVCHVCGAGFTSLVFLNLHRTRAHRPLTCRQCDATFVTRNDKKQHEINVHGLKCERKLRFPCPYCEDRFYQENFRVLHLVEKHGFARPEHRCVVCAKTFVTRSLLNNHTKNVHNKEKNHKCDICQNLFYTKSDLGRHRVTHTGERKHNCGVCNAKFTTKDSLRRHAKRAHPV
ncbi:zinc finger protein 596 isoform X1 [Bombyx mori]|uniref:Uncharacterized protein n=1 Tax=Bombyx mori TaxID=7091 RepID=A0A8R1WH22_BOMMO|nr:zinc finger protein 596 [Bombyx mori]